MSVSTHSILWRAGSGASRFQPTTLRSLGHSEDFLESRIAENPELLGLESLASGIQGPFGIVRQPSLQLPTDRTIFPDLVLVSRSGHVIVVEVKLGDNPDLTNRAVFAQIVEYSSGISTLAENGELDSLFDDELSQLARAWFPELENVDEFVDVVCDRCARGDIDLVVACDRSPSNFDSLAGALDRQTALAFRLRVVEVTPMICGDSDAILFLNREACRTEIIARNHVVVSWEGGNQPASVRVTCDSFASQEDSFDQASSGLQRWTTDQIRSRIETNAALGELQRSTLSQLLDLAVQLSSNSKVTARASKHPYFGWRQRAGQGGHAYTIWTTSDSSSSIWVYRNGLRRVLEESRVGSAESLFRECMGPESTMSSEYIESSIEMLAPRLSEFALLCKDLRAEIAPSGSV